MPDETPLDQVASHFEINLGTPGVVAVTFLATYGAVSLARDVRRKAKKILEERKAAQVVETPVTPPQTPAS